jgi:hypothetical protein
MSLKEIETYREGLMFAILAKKMKYTEELHPVDCSLDICNEESLDFGLDHMSRTEYEVYSRYKKQPIGPFRYVFKEGMGYDVVADRDIREKTLICEYIGEVVSLRRCIDLDATCKSDSLMELRNGCNSEETLIIRPDERTNMARFINGINNFKASSKANVATVRKLARGMPAVVLYSIRPIRRGESLLYDYNAGATNCKYDTSNFL